MRAKPKPKTPPAPKPEQDRFEWDASETGLAIRHRPGRKPAWYFQTRIDGKTVRRSLGPARDLSRAEAIASANDLQAELSGKTPLPVLVPDVPKASVANFAERFLRDGAPNWKPATITAHRYVISRFIVPGLGARDLASLSAEDVAAWRTLGSDRQR